MAAQKRSVRGLLAELVPGVDRVMVSVLLTTAFVLLVSDYEGTTTFWSGTLSPHFPGRGPAYEVAPYFWWFASSLVLYVGVPCLMAKVIGGPKLSELGFGLGDRKLGFRVSGALLALMVPVVVVASRFGTFQQQYPLCTEALQDRTIFVIYEISYALYFVSWEFLFRGYMLLGLRSRVGAGLAILIQTVPFALEHSGKPEAEAYGSIVAGVALGVLAVRTNSIWYGAGLHACIAIIMDLLAGWSRLK